MGILLVTVGSTKFDKLIEAISEDRNGLSNLINQFFIEKIVIQHGKSPKPTICLSDDHKNNIQIVMRDYLLPTEMCELLSTATVIISHGGAGTAVEVLRAQNKNLRAFVMVENDSLMDGHQAELISALIGMKCPVQRGNLKSIFSIETNCYTKTITSLPEPNVSVLVNILDQYILQY